MFIKRYCIVIQFPRLLGLFSLVVIDVNIDVCSLLHYLIYVRNFFQLNEEMSEVGIICIGNWH